MLYVGLTGFLFLLRYALASQHQLRRQVYFTVILGLFLFSAFRYQVGCDWGGYFHQFIWVPNMGWDDLLRMRDPLWWMAMSQIQNFSLPYPFVNIFSSSIFFLGVHTLARRQPDPLGYIILLLPILIINLPMSAIRQSVAIGFICIAFGAFMDRRPYWFSLWVVLASGFHSSVIIFMLALPICTGRYTRNRLVLSGLLAVPGILYMISGASAQTAFSRYVETDTEAFGAIFRVGILWLTGLYFLLILRRKWINVYPQDYSLASIGAIGMLLTAIVVFFSTVIGDRIGYYFIPVQAMIFARLPYLGFRSNAALHVALPYLGFFLVFLIWTQFSSHFQQCYIPYRSWLFGLPYGSEF